MPEQMLGSFQLNQVEWDTCQEWDSAQQVRRTADAGIWQPPPPVPPPPLH